MESALESNSTILATSILNASSACTATREAGVSSIRKSGKDAPRTRRAVESLCASTKRHCPRMACARKFYRCQRTPSSCPCTRQIWLTPIVGYSSINKISRKSAALDTSIKRRAAVSPDSNLRTRVVCACPISIALLLIPPFSLNANAATLPRAPSIAI